MFHHLGSRGRGQECHNSAHRLFFFFCQQAGGPWEFTQWHMWTEPRGAGRAWGTARASAGGGLSPDKLRRCWCPSGPPPPHLCPEVPLEAGGLFSLLQQQTQTSPSRALGSSWCRCPAAWPAPPWHQVKLRHSTGTCSATRALLARKEIAFTSSASQSAQNNMCIFYKVSLNDLMCQKSFLSQYKTGKLHTQ